MSNILTIGFSKPKSKFAFFGRAIMLYEGTPYSHCYIKFTTLTGVTLISQASKGMLNFMSVPAFEMHNEVVEEFHLEVSDTLITLIKQNSMAKAGLPYSTLQIIGIVVADLFNLDKNPFDTDLDTFVCSEYLGQILMLLDYKIPRDLSLLTPKDIYTALERKK
jgi:hypothetical protein